MASNVSFHVQKTFHHLENRPNENKSNVNDRFIKSNNNRERTYTSQPLDYKKYYNIIDKIISSNGRKLTREESEEVCSGINNSISFEQILTYVQSTAIPNKKKPEDNKKIGTNVYHTLLENTKCPWEIKKYLFTQMPNDCKTQKVYCSYFLAADRVNDFQSAKYAFQEVNSREMTTLKIYKIFLRITARHGYVQEAKIAFSTAKATKRIDSTLYATFLRVHAKNSDFITVQALFDEAIQNGYRDAIVYNAYIHIAGRHQQYALAKDAFLQLREKSKADAVSYTSFMNAAGIQGEFDDVKMAYDEAVELDLFDDKTLNSYINIAGKNGKYEESLNAYLMSKQLKIASKITYGSFMIAAASNGHLPEAKKAFEEARKFYPHDVDLFDRFIKVAGENNAYAEAYNLFNEAKRLKLATTSTFGVFIYVAGINKKMEHAKEAYELAIKLNLTKVDTHTRYIDASNLCANFDECRKAFNELKKFEMLDAIAITRYIQAARRHDEFGTVEESFCLAKDLGIMDSYLIFNYIEAAGAMREFPSAQKIFYESVENGIANIYIYCSYLNVAGNNGEFQEACRVFDLMIKQKIANEVAYTVMIKIAGLNNQYSFAKEVFQAAKINKLATSETYSTFIAVTGNYRETKETKETFQEALEMNFRDSVVYNSYLSATGKNNDLEAFLAIYDEIRALKKADAYTFGIYIDKMGKYGFLENAENAFHEALKLGFSDTCLFTSYMDVLRKNGKTREAGQIFEQIKKMGIADSRAYTSYINCNPSNLQAIAKEAIDKNSIGPEVFNSIIALEGKNGNYSEVKDAFLNAKKYKMINEITFSSYIDSVGKLNRFDEAREAFEEAIEKGYKQVAIYNCYLNIAAKAEEYERVFALFEEMKKLEIANAISFTIYINALSKVGNFLEIKKAFAEFRKFNVKDPDPVLYLNYLSAARKVNDIVEAKCIFEEARNLGIATPAIYTVYISLAGRIADELRIQNPRHSSESFDLVSDKETLSFDEARMIFLEAQTQGLINNELFDQLVDSAGRCKEFEEGKQALIAMKEQGFESDNAHNVLQNWKIKTALSPELQVNVVKNLPRDTSDPLYQLLNLSYRFLLGIKEDHAISTKTDQEIEAKTIPLPAKLLEKLDEEIQVIAKKGTQTVPIRIRSLLKSFVKEARLQNVSIQYARLVGGAAGWCEDAKSYRDSLENISNDKGYLSKPEHGKLFEQIIDERFSNMPNDWDFKILVNSSDPKQISEMSDWLIRDISTHLQMKLEDLKRNFLHKQCFVNKDGNLYSLCRLVDAKGTAYEFIIGGMFARPNLYHSDALQIPLEKSIFRKTKKSNAPIAVVGSVDQARKAFLLKRLKATNPETINEYGCSIYVARRSQGYYGEDESLESNIRHTLARLSAENIIKLLIHTRENHCENTSENGLSLLFHACSILSEGDNFHETEKLIMESELLWNPVSKHPFFKTLTQVWIKERCPFMELKAAFEMIGLLHLITKMDSKMHCKLDEHNGKQVIELSIDNCYFSVPLAPLNTFTAFSIASHSKSLERLIKVATSNKGLHFDPKFASHAAKFLGISSEHFELLKNRLKIEQKEIEVLPIKDSKREITEENEASAQPRNGWGFIRNLATNWFPKK